MKILIPRFSLVFMLGSLSLMIAAPQPGRSANKPDVASPDQTSLVRISGTLVAKDGKFLLIDSTTNLAYELRGAGLKRFVGKKVGVTGAALPGAIAAAGATQVLTVTSVSIAGAAAAAAPAAAAGAAASAGIGTGTIAVIGGVAVAATAGTVGGLYASGAIGDDQPASRP